MAKPTDHRTAWRVVAGTAGCLALTLSATSQALAHAADRGFVLLLPTGYYAWGGAAAVAFSAAALLFVPAARLAGIARARFEIAELRVDGRTLTSCLSFLILCGQIHAGFEGSRDPLANPLPLVIWTVWWVGFTLISGLFGNLWRWLEPWYGPARLVAALLRRDLDQGFLRLPLSIGQRPAIGLFFAFAWYELVYPAPSDPDRLAFAVAVYWLFAFGGILLFGHATWTRQAEPFSIFFRMIARLSPFSRRGDRLALVPPGAKLVDTAALTTSGTLFLLLALSTVSFDGLMHTFRWLAVIGVNPLEFEGRSSVMIANTVGMAGMFAVVAGAFFGAVALGARLAGSREKPVVEMAGLLVWSIVPIALAYHFSHYLVALVVNGQYALAAISDPLSTGANLFGTARYHVVTGVVTGFESARIIWNLQAGAIIGGHVFAVMIAHLIAWRIHGDDRRAVLSQLPLSVLMVAYTVFGLWLLSSPTA